MHRVSVYGILSDVYTMYTCPLGIISQRYGIKYRLYVDNTQLNISLNPYHESIFSPSLENLHNSFADIRLVMTRNIKFNGDKTNITYLVSAHYVKFLTTPNDSKQI